MPVAISGTSFLYQAPPGHLTLTLATKRSSSFTCELEPRTSYYLYIPTSHPASRRGQGENVGPNDSNRVYPLVVLVHGSLRDAESLRNWWSDVAEANDFVILAPVFPSDRECPEGVNNYKTVQYDSAHGSVRYDDILFNMIETVARDYGSIDTRQFVLSGFSGGGQFVHRFFYLYPERVSALSVASPGIVTPLTSTVAWPDGISGTEEIFGRTVDVDQIRAANVPIQLIVGDIDGYTCTLPSGKRFPVSRVDVINDLAKGFEAYDIPYSLVLQPGVRHEEIKLVEAQQAFVLKHLREGGRS